MSWTKIAAIGILISILLWVIPWWITAAGLAVMIYWKADSIDAWLSQEDDTTKLN